MYFFFLIILRRVAYVCVSVHTTPMFVTLEKNERTSRPEYRFLARC